MKRVVFFIVLFVMGCSTTYAGAASISEYVFPDYVIRTQESVIDGNRGYQLTKIGKNPFSRSLSYPDTFLHINNIVDIEGNHVLYGYVHQGDSDTYYQGFLTVLSPAGEELYYRVYDMDTEEDVLLVDTLGETIVVVVISLEMNDREQYDFLRLNILSLSPSYETMKTVELYQEPTDMMIQNNLLLLNFDYDSRYDLGITPTLDLIQDQAPLPIETDQVFQDKAVIPFLNEATLNGTVVEHGVRLDFPGDYILEYDNFSYHFTIEPTISGVTDLASYNQPVTPFISSGKVFLNDDLFVSGTPISDPGYYELMIQGINGYRKTISFTITSHLTGVIHNQTYHEPIEMSFNGTGYLNNGFITSPLIVEEPGEYILTIEGKNAYKETYYFAIEEPPSAYTMMDFLRQYDLAILGVTIVGGLLVLKKK